MKEDQTDSATLLASIRSGDTNAFNEIVIQYQSGIIRYLYRMTNNHEAALDLAQDTFVSAFRSIIRSETELTLKPWLYKIATNNALQYLRRKKFLSFIPFEFMKTAEPTGNNLHGNDVTETLAIEEVLKKIPRQQRTCLVLHFIEGFKYREIAVIAGISEDAVRKRIARGKENFRRFYNGGEEK